MTPGRLDAYLQALADALHERGHVASRIVEEAREHLIDAVEDGLRRGLGREEAEREALERFGPPDLLAAQTPPVAGRTMSRVTAALDAIVGNWRWMTGATAVAAMLAAAASYLVLPTFYRSESVIEVIAQPRVGPFAFEWTRDSQERMQSITATILSDARLDPIVKEFGLGTAPRARRNIRVEVLTPERPGAGPAMGSFTVGFQSSDPQLSQRVAQRLASLFIIENLEDSTRAARAIGDQFRITKPPSLPKDALRPGMAKMTVSGACAGLALSIAALIWRNRAA